MPSTATEDSHSWVWTDNMRQLLLTHLLSFFFTEVANQNIVHAISEARGGLPPLLSPLSGSGNVSGPVRDY